MKTLSFNTFFRKGFSSFLFIILSCALSAQVVPLISTDAAPAPVRANCMQIALGTTIDFQTTQSCDTLIDILIFAGDREINLAQLPDSTILKTGTSFSHQFNLLGSYVFQCNASVVAVEDIADICFTVVAEPIPALGEWALIILFLSITIIGVVGIKTYSSEAISQFGQRPIKNAEVA